MFIKKIKFTNLLSFGPENKEVELRNLNVIIGPNGSGKSNLIEGIGLLQAAPKALNVPIREGGGILDWLWKGAENIPTATIEAIIQNPFKPSMPIRYTLSFTSSGQRFELTDERVENERPHSSRSSFPYLFFGYQNNNPVFNIKSGQKTITRKIKKQDISSELSILSQRKDPDQYPEVTYIGEYFEKIKIFREWSFGQHAPARMPQKTDLPNNFLEQDCRNLGLVLNKLRRNPPVKLKILNELKELYEEINDFDVIIEGGTVQVFFQENKITIPAYRLSDGTLRYLCLLSILCHPNPPPLICIEEPELGLHPDILPSIARLIKQASEKTQLIITTHSDVLVDELSECPEDVIICEKENGVSSLSRLNYDSLKIWLEKYSLGELWRSGEIGGTRW